MVEVDPRLFVTCRLCLDVQGHFQIDPGVQQQIKYCFDIDVEPFDRLPQLICKKCENILRDYNAIKKSFIDKQKELKSKLQNNLRSSVNRIQYSTLDKTDSSTSRDDNIITRTKKKVKKKRINKRVLLSSDDDLDPNDTSTSLVKANAETDECKESYTSWEANYSKYYVCKICSQGFTAKKCITKHFNEHKLLQMKYNNVFKMSCLVVMGKCDDKPNICNSNKSVVYDSDYIIQKTHNPLYNIIYRPKTNDEFSKTYKHIEKRNSSDRESTDTEILLRKRRRFPSRSSGETVVINRHSEHEDTTLSALSGDRDNPPTIVDCIDLGDSSDNGSYESSEGSEINSNSISYKEGLKDSKSTIHIIKMCFNRHNKQLESYFDQNVRRDSNVKEEYLQHKVLSIGRKIINNKGFNCIGLLRFLECKGLSVIWKETTILTAGTDGKYVHIATALRRNENSNSNDAKWEQLVKPFKFNNEDMSVSLLRKLRTLGHFKKRPTVIPVINEDRNLNSVEHLPRISSVFSQKDLEITKTDSDNALLQKLLNKNPVSNPKQLPKKGNSSEGYTKNIKVFSAANSASIISVVPVEKNIEMNSNSMATVTSTIPVAAAPDKEKDIDSKSGDKTTDSSKQPQYPRIKVKPVSELMPERTISSLKTNETYSNGVHNTLQISNVICSKENAPISKQPVWPSQNTSASQNWQSQNDVQVCLDENVPLSEQRNNTVPTIHVSQYTRNAQFLKEYIILNTVEFPNTKTSSPFQYLQNLLLVHNINLINVTETPRGVSLIKIKLIYQQEKCESICLSLTLHCSRNLFYLEVKDVNLQHFDINILNASWQWQLLNTFNNDDVINKCLQTASKASTEMHQHTKDFFSLLKSIRSITIS